jgi:hypothetical protein
MGCLSPINVMADGSPGEADATKVQMRGIGWAVFRSHDPRKLADFYIALGFQEWASSERIIGLHAGGGASIEIGYLNQAAPANNAIKTRTYSSAAVVFGTTDAERVARDAPSAGQPAQRSLKPGAPETLRFITLVTRTEMSSALPRMVRCGAIRKNCGDWASNRKISIS